MLSHGLKEFKRWNSPIVKPTIGLLITTIFLKKKETCPLILSNNLNSDFLIFISEVNPEISSSKTKGTRHSSEPRKVAFFSGSSDEDPYSLTASGSSGSSRKDQAKNKSGFPMKQQQQQQQMQQHVDNSGSRMDHYATQERGSRLLLTETDSETMFAQNWAKVRA